MAFYHREDFCFRILSVKADVHKEQHKGGPSDRHRLIVYTHAGALSDIRVRDTEYGLSGVNMLLVPKETSFSRRGEREGVIVLELEIFGEEPTAPELIATPKMGALLPLFSKLLLEWENMRRGYLLRSHRLLYDIFEKLSHYDEPSKRDIQFNIVANGVRYFQKSYHLRDCTIEEAARLCSVSERYFRKLFTEIYGVAPTRYLREMRVKRACELIRTGKHSMLEVALQCGFDDPKYFSRVFHDVMNMTPTAFAHLAKK